eukprot:192900_1
MLKLLSYKKRMDDHYNWFDGTALTYAVCCEYNNNNSELRKQLLMVLLLDNCFISDKDKYKLLLVKDTNNGQNVLMKAKNDCCLLILEYFANDSKYLINLLSQKDKIGKKK